MTQQQGLYTIQTWLALTPAERSRLEWLVRAQGGDLADTLTRMVAEYNLAELRPAAERPAGEPLPVRVFLTAEQRDTLERFVDQHKQPLPDLLTQIVAARLADVPEQADSSAHAPAATPAELRRRRNELMRLRARRDAAGATAPAWLHAYIAELEAELALPHPS